MENKVLDTIKKYNMLSYGDSIVIGFSGGADSCALLHFLVSQREKMGLRLIACHVNHCLRGDEAYKDENFTRLMCEKYDVMYFCLRKDVASEAIKLRQGTELVGRNIRYSFFEEIADKYAAKIATAHTASDNAETILFNLTRGTGVKGLCGIPPVRDRIVRPLIEVTRSEIEAYCCDKCLEYVTDSTNLTDEYTRNRFRHNVIPELKAVNPSVEQALLRLSDTMREQSSLLSSLAGKAMSGCAVSGGYDAEKLKELDPPVFSELISMLCSEFDVVPDNKQIKLIRGLLFNGGAVEIRKDIFAVCRQGVFRISLVYSPAQVNIPFSHNMTFELNGRRYRVSEEPVTSVGSTCHFLSAGKIPPSAEFRYRKSGDVFVTPQGKRTKTVKKLFNELKIPSERRNSLLLLADGSDILWIEGVGPCADCTAEKTSDNILHITVD